MNIILWVIQGILAAIFTMSGLMKSTQPIDKLLKSGINWAERFPLTTVRLIGISQLLGAIGLILPMLLNFAPILTPLAASGLALTMLLAIFHHLKYKENKAIITNILIMAMALFVAYGRFTSL
jgi:uncharacterized membrane protein YphA (DoxX/SURF4 family)